MAIFKNSCCLFVSRSDSGCIADLWLGSEPQMMIFENNQTHTVAMELTLDRAVKRLFTVWLAFAVVLILFLFLQTVFRKYGDKANSAWAWFALCVLPGIALILFSYFRYKRSAFRLIRSDALLFRLVYTLSFAYLGATMLALLLQPFGDAEKSAAENLHSTNTGLLIFQAIVIAAAGVFVYRTQKQAAQPADDVMEEIFDVFISYNHANKTAADKVKNLLQEKGLSVCIDSETMLAGEDIRSFIIRSVKSSRVTLAIVSKESLLSGWVSLETVDTFSLQKFSSRKRFIAGYLDESFFDMRFTAEAIKSIDARLQQVGEQIAEHNRLGVDTRDLNDEKSRLMALRSHMDEIIGRLRNSLCLDLRDDKLPETFPALLKSIETI